MAQQAAQGDITREASSERRAEIVSAARDLYEEKGLARTTVKDISDRVGVTRSLFYHYFDDKDAVTAAVMDDIVDDFVELVHLWNESRVRGDVVGDVRSCVRMLKQGLYANDPFRRDLVRTENAALYLQFSARTAETLSNYLAETTVVEYRQYHPIEIECIHETFYMLIVGLIGLVRRHPDTDDEVLMDVIIRTLHLDVGDEWPPANRPKQ